MVLSLFFKSFSYKTECIKCTKIYRGNTNRKRCTYQCTFSLIIDEHPYSYHSY
ncbi:MAG TPA: hypothetical protein DCL62_04985 [Kandleria vitulina]|nr:hypothetical protein [Kandleria vitulina]